MTNRKRWSNAEITGAAEEEIVFWIDAATKAAKDGRRAHVDYGQGAARGVFGLWRYLTGGQQNPADVARLEALAHRGLDADPARTSNSERASK